VATVKPFTSIICPVPLRPPSIPHDIFCMPVMYPLALSEGFASRPPRSVNLRFFHGRSNVWGRERGVGISLSTQAVSGGLGYFLVTLFCIPPAPSALPSIPIGGTPLFRRLNVATAAPPGLGPSLFGEEPQLSFFFFSPTSARSISGEVKRRAGPSSSPTAGANPSV